MALLLVSVRSASEAKVAMAAGASIIDVKDPDAGSLGRAESSIWQGVRSALPPQFPISVALGELDEWLGPTSAMPREQDFLGIAFCKLGLAGSGANWREEWKSLRAILCRRLAPSWVAVTYADWQAAHAPPPDAVLEAALEAPEIAGLLVDTWDKARPAAYSEDWIDRSQKAQASGRFVAIAGGIELSAIKRLAQISPDIIAVRGAACKDGDRRSLIDPERVARLADAAAAIGEGRASGILLQALRQSIAGFASV